MAELSQYLNDAVFYGIVDTGYVPHEKLPEKCAALAAAGTKIIQLRAKREDAPTRRELALKLLPIFEKPNAPFFVINDDVELAADICRKIENAGLHVGQDDLPVEDARKAIGARRILGLSTHSREQAFEANSKAQTLDYFAVGPVYCTMTKPGRPAVGLDLVKYAARELRPQIPWFCIGGINLATAAEVAKSGGERIVAVSEVLKPDDTAAAVRTLVEKFLAGKAAR